MKSVASVKSSKSVSSFLHRNFYTIKEQKDFERRLAEENYKEYEADKRRVESARYGGSSIGRASIASRKKYSRVKLQSQTSRKSSVKSGLS